LKKLIKKASIRLDKNKVDKINDTKDHLIRAARKERILALETVEHRSWMKFLVPMLILIESVDSILTYSAVGKGVVNEANPVLKSFIGTENFIFMKISGSIVSSLLLWFVYKRFPKIGVTATITILIFYLIVLTWNTVILSRFSLF
jgi:Domain of unknown function (DUF5658)